MIGAQCLLKVTHGSLQQQKNIELEVKEPKTKLIKKKIVLMLLSDKQYVSTVIIIIVCFVLLAKGNYVFPISTPYLGIHERLLLKKTLECKRKLVYLVVWPIEISIFYIYQHISMFKINVLPILSQNMFSLHYIFCNMYKKRCESFCYVKM